MKLEKKTIILTGASSGIGQELMRLLLLEGARVYAFDRQTPATTHKAMTFVQMDLCDPPSIEAAFKRVKKPIDLLINNAGIMRRGKVLDSTEEEYDLLMDVNVKGSWLMLKHALPRLASDAAIVQMLSRHALYPPEDPALYAASKIAIDRILDFFERSYPQHPVKRIYPGPTDTPLAREGLTPEQQQEKAKTMFAPADLAALIITLIKEDKTKVEFDPRTWSHMMA